MTNANYVRDFLEKMKKHTPIQNEQQSYVSSRVIELADQINAWHETRPIPERWNPVQLGRLAAQFDTSREALANALHYGGWIETRKGSFSYWNPKI